MVASARPVHGSFVYLNQRLVEWSLVALLLGALVVAFLHQVRVVQRQAEFANIRTTLGALRTAFVMQHLQAQLPRQNPSVAQMQRNPFDLLAQRPVNYRGVIQSKNLAMVPTGGWVFDPVCGCVGYVPLDSAEFDSASGDAVAWFVVNTSALPFQLTAKEAYVWQGQVLD
jgi:hypothetical protein